MPASGRHFNSRLLRKEQFPIKQKSVARQRRLPRILRILVEMVYKVAITYEVKKPFSHLKTAHILYGLIINGFLHIHI